MADPEDEIRVGISSCLLGEEVRYNGGHKRYHWATDVLSRYFTFVPVCPEVELGLGVPRETLRLVRDRGNLRLVAPATGADHTESMHRYAARRTKELARLDLSGYLLKKGSPSCGAERVRVYTTAGMPSSSDGGFFAKALMTAMPLLPVEEEGRLNDPALRESFVERVFAYHRLRRLFRSRWKCADLIRFHAAEKILIMAHDPRAQTELGRIVAESKHLDRRQLADAYQRKFMEALGKPAPRRRQVNALQHMAGYLKQKIGSPDRRQIAEVIDDFRRGLIPVIVPLTLIRHYVKLHAVDYLEGQSYLEPHPKELMLRNHA
jgi:uncharacterized protein YbgA (DUF1722 family)/uncharacterized protein YbbK (DUF523 family)